jgi:hypothetical protein
MDQRHKIVHPVKVLNIYMKNNVLIIVREDFME